MLKRTLNRKFETTALCLLAGFVLMLSGCVAEEKDDKTAGSTATPATPRVVYSSGFFDEEKDGNNSWRWMEPTGVARLRNTGKDMELTITGRPPVEHFKQAPTITITLNGTKLDEYKGSNDMATKTFTVTPAQQGDGEWSELKISSDMSFVPKEVAKTSTDGRRLAFSLTGLIWKLK
jgi:hypothetical protein